MSSDDICLTIELIRSATEIVTTTELEEATYANTYKEANSFLVEMFKKYAPTTINCVQNMVQIINDHQHDNDNKKETIQTVC